MQLRDAVKGMHFATITTHGADGEPRSRGVTVRVADYDGDLWLTADVDTQLLAEVHAAPKAVVLLSDRRARRNRGMRTVIAGQNSFLTGLPPRM